MAAYGPERPPWHPRIRTLRESKAGPQRETVGALLVAKGTAPSAVCR
jgi:hypothetical protein